MQGTVCLLKYQPIRIGITAWMQPEEYAFVFFMIAMNYLFKLPQWYHGLCQAACARLKRKKMFFEDWKCAKECKFLLTGEQAVYHELGIFFSWLITIDCSHKYLLRRCTKIIVPLEFMWKLMPASTVLDFFPLVFLHIFLVMLWSE